MFKKELNNSDLLNKSLSLKALNCPWKVPEVCLSEVVRTMVFTFVCLVLKLNRVSKWSMILYDPRTRNLSHLQFLVKSWSCRLDGKYWGRIISRGYFHYNEAVKRAMLTLRISADENVFFHFFVWHGLNFFRDWLNLLSGVFLILTGRERSQFRSDEEEGRSCLTKYWKNAFSLLVDFAGQHCSLSA